MWQQVTRADRQNLDAQKMIAGSDHVKIRNPNAINEFGRWFSRCWDHSIGVTDIDKFVVRYLACGHCRCVTIEVKRQREYLSMKMSKTQETMLYLQHLTYSRAQDCNQLSAIKTEYWGTLIAHYDGRNPVTSRRFARESVECGSFRKIKRGDIKHVNYDTFQDVMSLSIRFEDAESHEPPPVDSCDSCTRPKAQRTFWSGDAK